MRLPKKLRLKVLRRHIVKGTKGINSGAGLNHCVVAEALRERFPNRHIEVGYSFAEVGAAVYSISTRGNSFIHRAVEVRKAVPTTITLTRER